MLSAMPQSQRSTPLVWILLLGATLRIAAALTSTGYEHPHEIHRLFEPIAKLQGYDTHPSWEFDRKILPMFPIYVHYFFFEFLRFLGLERPDYQATAVRVIYALLSCIAIPGAYYIARYARGTLQMAKWSALLVAVWPEFIYRSVRIMDYTWEAIALAICIFLAFSKKFEKPAVFIGITLGFAFFFRYHSGLYLICFAVFYLLQKETWEARLRTVGVLLGSYGAAIFLISVAEALATSRTVLQPFWNYFEYNIVEGGAARDFGADPWHRYFSEGAKVLGFAPFVFLLLGLPFLAFKKRSLFWPITKSPFFQTLLFVLIPFLSYSLISHKEDRFLFGFMWLSTPLVVMTYFEAWNISPRKRLTQAFLSFLFLGYFLQAERIQTRFFANSNEMRAFTDLGAQLKQHRSIGFRERPELLPGSFFIRPSNKICYQCTAKTMVVRTSTGWVVRSL